MKEKTFVDDVNRSMYDFRYEEKDSYRVSGGLTPEIIEQIDSVTFPNTMQHLICIDLRK